MKLTFKHFLTIAFALLTTFNVLAATVTLQKHTSIPVRLTQNINGNLDNQGDLIYFEVLENIEVDGHIVVSKGTFVKGKITNAETRKSMGKAGKLTIEARTLQAVNGQRIDIIRDDMTSEGRKRTGATVAHVIMWGPIGLLAKGRAARIMMDTEYDIEVESDVVIDISTTVQQQADLSDTGLDIYFNKYKSKINYAKGKSGKDFILNIVLPQSTQLSIKDIEIVEVKGNNLPEVVNPSSINWNKRSNSFVATIPFDNLIKYISEGTSTVKVKVITNNETMVGEAKVETKWKLK